MIYLEEHLLAHPLMQPSDAAKFCFQAVYGAEHLLADPTAARSWFFREFDATLPVCGSTAEALSDRYCRVNLAAWKEKGLSGETLFSLFLKTAQTPSGAEPEAFESALAQVRRMAKDGCFAFSENEWCDFLAQYPRCPVHHSEIYRNAYQPSYRVVDRMLLSADFF